MAVDDYFDPPVGSAHTYPVRSGGQSDPDQMRAAAMRLTDRADALLCAAREAEIKLAKFGPEPPDGSVVRFKKELGGHRYTYAAIRKRGVWFLTQGKSPFGLKPAMSWARLIEYVGDAKLKLATDWKELGSDG